MTTKKNYAKPSVKVIMIDGHDLIATSGGSQRSVSLGFDLDNPDEDGSAD